MMDRNKKLELIERSLGLKHKLKVHDSMRQPDTHDEVAVMMLARWDFEDEIQAIDEVLMEVRQAFIKEKKATLLKQSTKSKKNNH